MGKYPIEAQASSAMMKPIHLRMARAALNWTLSDLEKKTGVSRNTISRFESGQDILAGSLQKLEDAVTDAGILFFEGDRVLGTGVGLKKRQIRK